MSRFLPWGSVALVLLASVSGAEPALGRPRVAGPLPVVYADTRDTRVFYYPPGPIEVARDASGGPDLRFLQVVYMGSFATGDPGRFLARSVLSFRVVMQPPAADDLRRARVALPAGSRLLPLPIRRAETRLVFTPLEGPAGGADTPAAEAQPLGEGRLEESDAAGPADGYWTERIFTLNPAPASSQALWDALGKGRVLLSLSLTLLAEGDLSGPTAVSGTPAAVAALPPAASPTPGADAAGPERGALAVRSDALAIVLDGAELSDRLKRVDINQSLPPGFAALDVRCYDFDNDLRPDLAIKNVEIAAAGVSGRPVTRTASFRQSARDLSSATVRFPFAVRLDRPFRYRVIEVRTDGSQSVGPWHEDGDWARLLDVTTPAAERPSPTPTPSEDPPLVSDVREASCEPTCPGRHGARVEGDPEC